jgi:ABC-type lipoprotein export system ATPase subunit
MTLTTVVGSSGSGKTTFLNDVRKSHQCIYIRQYHNIRPYITVAKIPNFDPTNLPYWSTYVAEERAATIKVGGTMAGQFTAGLSGGQRKLLLFELICQRIRTQHDLLIVLDEPFAGVTDDFIPFIIERLQEMRTNHNVVLVTNDHVETLTKLADNTITVSAMDRTKVRINQRPDPIDREKTIAALSLGGTYTYDSTVDEYKFFWDVEVYNNQHLVGVAVFVLFAFGLLLLTYWNSDQNTAGLVLIGASTVAFMCLQPFMVTLVEWRDAMREESEALLHSSKGMNKVLKTLLSFMVVFIISFIEYGCINAIITGFEDFKFWVAILFDGISIIFPSLVLGIFTTFPQHIAILLGAIPFLLGIVFSTTFSPGSGLPVVSLSRYLFARFYFWCMVPGVKEYMARCPSEDMNLIYLVLSSFLCLALFLFYEVGRKVHKILRKRKVHKHRKTMMSNDFEFQQLQESLYGEKVLQRFKKQMVNNMTPSSSTSDFVYMANATEVVC